jgi:hypothetical protein
MTKLSVCRSEKPARCPVPDTGCPNYDARHRHFQQLPNFNSAAESEKAIHFPLRCFLFHYGKGLPPVTPMISPLM